MEDWDRLQAGHELEWLALSEKDMGRLVLLMGQRAMAVLIHPPHNGLVATLTVLDLRVPDKKWRVVLKANTVLHMLVMAASDVDRAVLHTALDRVAREP